MFYRNRLPFDPGLLARKSTYLQTVGYSVLSKMCCPRVKTGLSV